MAVQPTHLQPISREDADRRLLDMVARRDREAFRELYIVYHRRLARFLMRLTRRYEVTEEIINDTMWVVWRKAGDFRGESRISTWIMGIAYRRALKTMRSGRLADHDTVPVDEALLVSADEMADAEISELILRSMQYLPTDQRLAMEFAYGYGYSCEEIALIMNCPANTVKTRLFHARRKLRQVLPDLAGHGERP